MDAESQYEQVIERITRRPLTPVVGHSVFIGLITAAWISRNVFGYEDAGPVLLLLFLVYPYYCVQLSMQWRMRRHQAWAMRLGVNPTYVPSWARGWAGVYVGFFFAIVGVAMGLESLLGL